MKRLVYITNNRIPAERAYSIQIMHMCVEFSKLCVQQGWKFELVTAKHSHPLGSDPFEYHGFPRTFKITWLACIDAIRNSVQLGPLAYWIQAGSFIVSLCMWRLKQHDKLIIFTRELFIAQLFSVSIWEAHTIPSKPSWLFRSMIRRCRHIVAITNGLKEDLVQLGCVAELITVAPDGIDLERFGDDKDRTGARRELNIREDIFTVVYTGSFFQHAWKGVDVILGAAQQLSDKNILFILVGGQPEELARMDEYLHYPNIRLVEHTSHEIVRNYLAAADVVVLPNKSGVRMSNRYTSPLKLFEYMAARRLIIASDLPSVREIVDERSAILIEPGNSNKLSDVIVDLSKNSTEHGAKILHAYDTVRNYTWGLRAKRIFQILEWL